MNNKDIAVGTVFSTLLYEDLYGLSWKGKRLKVSHPMIHFRRGRSIFDKYVLFREIQRNMGYSNDLNIMNAYVQTCQNACFQNEFDKFKKGYIDLADELCMAEPNAHESCNYFLKLSKLLNMNGEWGNLFGTKARPITGTDHVTHQTHIAFVCKDTPGAFEEIYEFAPNSPESSVFDFKNKEKNQ